MEKERYTLTISADHKVVRLADTERAAGTRVFTGPKALYDALGVLAEWRDRDRAQDGQDTEDVDLSGPWSD